MPRKGSSVQSSLKGLRSFLEAVNTMRNGRVDVGFFASEASREAKGGEGSKPGFYKPDTSAETIAALKAGETPPEEKINNPELAAKHEYGIGVPHRSMLIDPLHRFGDKVVEDARADVRASIKQIGKNPRGVAKKILTRMGIGGENLVQEAFETSGFGSWPPNAEMTIALKGSDRPLIDTGQLRRAVTSRVVA